VSRETVGNESRAGNLTVTGALSVGSVVNPTFTGVAQFPDGSASAPSITNTGDTNTGLFHPAEDTVAISTGGTERVRVDASGRVLVNTTAGPSAIGATAVTVEGTNFAGSTIAVGVNSNNSNPSYLIMRKSRGTTVGSNTATQSGDALGRLQFYGADGTTNVVAAVIDAQVDGTVSTGVVPGRILMSVANSSGTNTERLRLDSNGLITGTGTSLGAWTAYTPTLGGTGWAIGDGTVLGAYCQIGKVVFFRASVTFGSTSTFGAVWPVEP